MASPFLIGIRRFLNSTAAHTQIHAQQDKNSSGEEIAGYLFFQHQPAQQYAHQWLEKEKQTRLMSRHKRKSFIPAKKRQGGGDKGYVKNSPQNGGAQQSRPIPLMSFNKYERQ